MFCHQYGLTTLPASTDSLNGFAIITALRAKSSHTVSNYISALKLIHHVLDLPLDSFSDFSLLLTLRGLHRSMIYVFQQKCSITIQMLYQFAEILLPGGHINNICLLACILVGFSLSSVLQTCFQNPLANLTLTPFDNSPEAPSDSMMGVSYSPFFIPKVVSSPTSHSAF